MPIQTLLEKKVHSKLFLESNFKAEEMADIPRPCQISSLCMDDDKCVCNEQMDWLKLDDKLPIWSRLKVVNCIGNLRDLELERSYAVEIPDRLWSLWGNSDKQTAIGKDMLTFKGHDLISSILALCVSLRYNLNSWTSGLLDNIVAKGSEIFLEMIQKHNMTDLTFNEKFLTASYFFNDTIFNVKLQHAASGYVYMPFGRGEYNMSRALVWFFKNYQFGLIYCNFRVLAIGYAVDINNGFFMYDCQSRGPPLMPEDKHNSYILRASHLQILVYCVIVALNVVEDNIKFDTYVVDIQSDDKLPAKLAKFIRHEPKLKLKIVEGQEKKVFLPRRNRAEAIEKCCTILNDEEKYANLDEDKENKMLETSTPITSAIPQLLVTERKVQDRETSKQEVPDILTKNRTTQASIVPTIVMSKGTYIGESEMEKNEPLKSVQSKTVPPIPNTSVIHEPEPKPTIANTITKENEKKPKIELVRIRSGPLASASTLQIIHNPPLNAAIMRQSVFAMPPMKQSIIENKSSAKVEQTKIASPKASPMPSRLKNSSVNKPKVRFVKVSGHTPNKTQNKLKPKLKSTMLKKSIPPHTSTSASSSSSTSKNRKIFVHKAFATNPVVKPLQTAASSPPKIQTKCTNCRNQTKASEKNSKEVARYRKNSLNPANIVLSTQYASSNNNTEPKIYLVKNEEKANSLKYKTSNPKIIVVNKLSDLMAGNKSKKVVVERKNVDKL